MTRNPSNATGGGDTSSYGYGDLDSKNDGLGHRESVRKEDFSMPSMLPKKQNTIFEKREEPERA